MPCYRSKPAWENTVKGRKSISFAPRHRTPDYFIDCGKCEGCRARHRTDWAVRIFHEASLWDRNCFLTLTYDDEHLPEDGRIRKDDIQHFIKRLRKQSGRPIRYYAVGEYGENTRRPHYHAIIFNEDFLSSRYYHEISDSMYGNGQLQRTWGQGQVTISEFNLARAKYTAGYVTKKIGDTDNFSMMSRRPPIGMAWLRKNHDNIRRLESIQIDGNQYPIPRVYLNWLKGTEAFDHIKRNLRQTVKPLNDQKLRAKRAHYLSKQNLRTEKC